MHRPVAVSRENRERKTDRLETELLKRDFLGGCVENGATHPGARCRLIAARGRPSAQTGKTRVMGGEKHAHCEPDKSTPGRAGHSTISTDLRKAVRTSGNVHTQEGMPLPPIYFSDCSGIMARWACYEPDSGRSR